MMFRILVSKVDVDLDEDMDPHLNQCKSYELEIITRMKFIEEQFTNPEKMKALWEKGYLDISQITTVDLEDLKKSSFIEFLKISI